MSLQSKYITYSLFKEIRYVLYALIFTLTSSIFQKAHALEVKIIGPAENTLAPDTEYGFGVWISNPGALLDDPSPILEFSYSDATDISYSTGTFDNGGGGNGLYVWSSPTLQLNTGLIGYLVLRTDADGTVDLNLTGTIEPLGIPVYAYDQKSYSIASLSGQCWSALNDLAASRASTNANFASLYTSLCNVTAPQLSGYQLFTNLPKSQENSIRATKLLGALLDGLTNPAAGLSTILLDLEQDWVGMPDFLGVFYIWDHFAQAALRYDWYYLDAMMSAGFSTPLGPVGMSQYGYLNLIHDRELDEAAAWQNQSAALALSILQTEEGYINDALSEINYCIIFATNNNDVQGIDFFNGLKLHLQSELDVVAKLKNTATALQGSLQVNIYPEEAVNAGAEWKLTTDSTWYPDGYTLIGLQTGSVTVEFKSITGWTCPNEKTVDIQPSQTAKIIGLYKRFGELDDDCTVDFKDFAVLTSWWLEGCTEPNWCESTDFDHSTIVDIRDLEIFTDSWLWALSDYYFITKWGTSGNGDGQFDRPLGVTADFNGYVYVVDAYNNRIQKFTVDGDYVTKWGQRGSGIGQFITPRDIAVDSSDFIYVTDNHNHRVQKFTSNGTYVMQWGNAGRSNGEFSYPSGIDTGPLGFIYVADYGNHRVQKFTSTGAYVTQWGSSGSGDGQFRFPIELAIDSSGYVYVADADNHRIQKWTSNGVFVGWWGGCNDPSHAGSGHWHGPGSSHQPQPGTGDGQFTGTISGVGVDSSGNVYVTDQSNRFQKFDSNGGFIGWWGGCSNPSHTGTGHWHEPGSGHQPQQGSGDGQFDYPVSLDVDSNGNVYVTDYYNYRVQKFSPCCAE